MIWSLLYRVACAMFQLLALRLCPSGRKELEIIVLHHELAIARRQLGRPRPTAADRALLAALSNAMPRSAFVVSPKTLLRCHRQLVSRHWTYDRRRPGRPAVDEQLQSLILRLARENPRWGYRRIVCPYSRIECGKVAPGGPQFGPLPRFSTSRWRSLGRLVEAEGRDVRIKHKPQVERSRS